MKLLEPTSTKNEISGVAKKTLSQHIVVSIRVIGPTNHEEISQFKVNINDKISKLNQLLASQGFLIHNKVTLSKEKLDETFAKAKVQNGDKFALLMGKGAGSAWGEPLLWKRMKTKLLHYYVRERSIDAVEFVPK